MVVAYTFTEEAERRVEEDLVEIEPDRAHGPEDAAYDLRAVHGTIIFAGAKDTCMVRTGVRVAIPEGCAGLVLPRSGLANKHGLIIPNSPGLIDPGYRGEILVGLRKPMTFSDVQQYQMTGNMSTYEVIAGHRIAQLLIVGPNHVPLMYVSPGVFESDYCNTKRGSGGFGSTGA